MDVIEVSMPSRADDSFLQRIHMGYEFNPYYCVNALSG